MKYKTALYTYRMTLQPSGNWNKDVQGKAYQISGALKGSTSYAIKLNSQGTDTDRKAACRHRKCKDCGGASICAHRRVRSRCKNCKRHNKAELAAAGWQL